MPAKLEIILFGQPVIRVNRKKITVDTRKATALIAYLAVKNQPVSRDVLCNLLWTDYPGHNARSALRRTLSVSNSALNNEWLVADTNTIALTASPHLYVDANHFRNLLEQAEQHHHPENQLCETCASYLTEAVKLYQEDFLAGFNLRDSINFEQWQAVESEELQRKLELTLEKLAYWNHYVNEFEKAIAYGIRWLNLDPLNEEANLSLMHIYAKSGQRSAALRQYQNYANLLDNELGISPMQETTEFYEKLRSETISPVSQVSPLLLSSEPMQRDVSLPTNLPNFTTKFIGREKDIQEIVALLKNEDCRLLTLVGPTGIGKTRLIVELVQQGLWGDVVYFLPLSEIESLEELKTAIQNIWDWENASNYVQSSNTQNKLVILDGFEKHLAHVNLIQELLPNAGSFKIVAISHTSLNVQNEWLFQLRGLPILDPNDLQDSSAIELFASRAKQINAKFSMSANRQTIQEICQILEGIPLSIELATQLTQFMSCHELAEALKLDFKILSTSLQNLPPRHRSIQALFEHAWNLLNTEEQLALCQLTIFEGGFDKAAVQNITEIPFETLSRLIEKSFIGQGKNGHYFIYHMFYPYACNFMRQDAEVYRQLQAKHAPYYTALLAGQNLETTEQAVALDWITANLKNISSAWNWAVAYSEIETLQACLHNLFQFYENLSLFKEGQDIFSQSWQTLKRNELDFQVKQEVISRLIARDAVFRCHLNDYQTALDLFNESRDLCTGLALWEEVAFVENYLGIISTVRGEYAEAKTLLQHSLDIYEELKIPLGTAKVLNNMGILNTYQGCYHNAINILMQSLTIYKSLGNERFVAYTFNNLGKASLGLENFVDAESFFKESYRIKKNLGDEWGAACTLINIGQIAEVNAEYQVAQQSYRESLEICTALNKQNGIIIALSHLGNLAVKTCNSDDNGVRYFLKALSLIRESGLQYRMADNLIGICVLFMRQGKRIYAQQFLQLVAHDEQASQKSRERARQLLNDEFDEVSALADNEFMQISRDDILKEILSIEHRWALEL